MKSECIEYQVLPGQSALFLSYLESDPKVSDWYALPTAATDDTLLEAARRALATPHLERELLAASMSQTLELLGVADADDLLAKLAASDCVAVVTGQQVGLFGGPAYSVYKAVSAIHIARRLEQLGQPAVPVFWLASDDSDFAEVRSSFFAVDGAVTELRYPEHPADGQMTGAVGLTAIEEVYRDAPDGLALNGLQRFYRPDADFRQAFGSWMADLFKDEGLLLFDPLSDGFRKGLEPLVRRAITAREEIVERLLRRDRELREAGFSPQVHVDERETLLFWVEDGRRFKLEFAGGAFKAKGRGDLRWTPEQLESELERRPDCLSSNALLRPLLQEHILPTAVTVGGPGEIAYFSQIDAIAPLWDLRPGILPRAGFTIVDRQVQRLLDRHGLEAREFLADSADRMVEQVLQGGSAGPVLEKIDALRKTLDGELKGLAEDLSLHDTTVASMLETSSRKIFYQLDKVRKRFVANSASRDATLRRQLDLLSSRLRPAGGLQERRLNFNQFLSDDPGLIGKLLKTADPSCGQHQIVYL